MDSIVNYGLGRGRDNVYYIKVRYNVGSYGVYWNILIFFYGDISWHRGLRSKNSLDCCNFNFVFL